MAAAQIRKTEIRIVCVESDPFTVRQRCALEPRLPSPDEPQIGIRQICQTAVCSFEYGFLQIRIGCRHARQIRVRQNRAAEAGFDQICTG